MKHRPINRAERRDEYPQEREDLIHDIHRELKRLDERQLQKVLWNVRKRGGC